MQPLSLIRPQSGNSVFLLMSNAKCKRIRTHFDSYTKTICKAIKELKPLFEDYFLGKSPINHINNITKLEKKADKYFDLITKDLEKQDIEHVEKEILIRVLFQMQDMVNYGDFVGQLVNVGHDISCTEKVQKPLLEMVNGIVEASDALQQALLEHCDRQRSIELDKIVSKFELKVDEQYLIFLRALIEEKSFNHIQYDHFKSIATNLENLSDDMDEVIRHHETSIFSCRCPIT